MKSVLITFDQAYYERIMSLLDRLGCRGFTYLEKVQGRGSKTGDPHFGSHAWPSMCSAIITVVEDHKVDPLLDTLHKMDLETEQLGLRAFVANYLISVYFQLTKRGLTQIYRRLNVIIAKICVNPRLIIISDTAFSYCFYLSLRSFGI